jgi:putative sugar O-methyltransferase
MSKHLTSIFSKLIGIILILKTRLLLSPWQFYLAKIKRFQKDKFENIKEKCVSYYKELSLENVSEFTTPLWETFSKKMERVILPHPCFSFLRDKLIMQTMFVWRHEGIRNVELNFLEKLISKDELKIILEEDYIGNPILINFKYLTSQNSIRHLYHLIFFQNKTGVDLKKINRVIEWGGGYGNMAKIFKRINPKITYIIIDLPLLTCLQWLYLAVIFGEDQVNILKSPSGEIKEEKVNLLPISSLKNYNLKGDLFIATWSLSESSKYAQDYVKLLNFFDAKHFLIGYQASSKNLPNAGRIGEITKETRATIYPIEFLPGNYYAVK